MKLIDFYTKHAYRRCSRMPKPRGRKESKGRIIREITMKMGDFFAIKIDMETLKGIGND